jgi:hypothetical protein
MDIYHLSLGLLNLILHRLRWKAWRIHPRRFLMSMDAVPIDRPIFLLGVQGGGLTLISRMLRRHTSVLSVTGNNKNWAGPDEMHVVMDSYLPDELSGINNRRPPNPNFPKPDWLYAIDELLPQYRKTSADASPELEKRFKGAIRLAITTHSRDPQHSRFLDKSQSYTVRLSLINHLLRGHQPYFILITRNPYAMCYRAANITTPLSDLNISLEERLQLAAQHWSNSYQCAIEDSHRIDHLLEVRFEDILQDVEKWLREICAFVELDFKLSMLPAPDHRMPLGSTGSSKGDKKWYPIRPEVNYPYLERLDPWMVEIVDNRVKELARRWEYSPQGP